MNSDEIDFKVLLIEDNELDVEKIKRSFKKLNFVNPIIRAKDGVEALELLKNFDLRVPLLILLDINMPRMNGIEFLSEIRKISEYKKLCVVVLTTSENDKDIEEAYTYNISGYLVKPQTLNENNQLLTRLHEFWSYCKFPTVKK